VAQMTGRGMIASGIATAILGFILLAMSTAGSPVGPVAYGIVGLVALGLIGWGLFLPAGAGPRAKAWAWITFGIGALYFLLPLIATIDFSLKIRRGGYTLDAYTNVFTDPRFQSTFGFSLLVGLATIVVGLIIVVPAAYYVRLRAPHLRPIIEFVTLLPLIIPAIVLVFGYIRLYNTSSFLPLMNSTFGTIVLLTLAYVARGLPYMYRAVDTGLRTIDVATLTEAATILGANQLTVIAQVIFPNIIVAVLSGAFLTLAIVIGEFTMSSLLAIQTFGVYMQNIGANKAYEPAALSIISFALTWGAMGMIQVLGRFAPKTSRRTD
jgi:putative spermidine/putrescine transport system permease protein